MITVYTESGRKYEFPDGETYDSDDRVLVVYEDTSTFSSNEIARFSIENVEGAVRDGVDVNAEVIRDAN